MATSGNAGTSATSSRPLSPHLQIYRLPLVAIMSITHRATGVGNVIGLAMLTCWLLAAASGEGAYDGIMWFFGSFIGQLMLFGWTLSLYYHLCNGLRHLGWDIGLGFELADAERSGQIVIGATLVLTVLTWIVGYVMLLP